MLIFNKLSEGHLETLRRWRMDPDVSKYLLTNPTITSEQQKQWFETVKDGSHYRCWIANYDGKDIGYVNLSHIDWNNFHADPGMYICEHEYRGKGLAKPMMHNLLRHAFEHMALNKVFGPVVSSNAAAVAAYVKAGFSIEGYFRKHIYKDHVFQDVVMVAISHSEWNGMVPKAPPAEFEAY